MTSTATALRKVERAAEAANRADAALVAAFVAARDAGATYRALRDATGGRFASPESIRRILEREDSR